MEKENVGKSKVIGVLEKIPSWVQMLITIGTLIFGLGTMYATLQDVKYQVSNLKDVPVINARQDADINNLRKQMEDDKTTQSQTNGYISKLADAVSSLSTSVARLEGKLDAEDKRKHR